MILTSLIIYVLILIKEEVPLKKILLVVLAFLFLGDVLSTEIILSAGGVEYNPIAGLFVENVFLHMIVKLAILIFFYAIVFIADWVIGKYPSVYFPWFAQPQTALFSIVIFYLFVNINNFSNIVLFFKNG